MRRILLMVHELHRMGYERLRIRSGLSASGMHWRCSVFVAGRPEIEASFSSGSNMACFGWDDAVDDAPGDLARKFVERFPAIAAVAKGGDAAYASWFVDMLRQTAPEGVPVEIADFDLPTGGLPVLGCEAKLVPHPPPFGGKT